MAAYAGPRESRLNPDQDTAWTFLSWWFRGCTQGRIEIGWMDPAGTGLTRFRRFEVSDIVDAAQVACEASAIPGQSVYVRASTINTPDGGNTTDANFVQSPGIWGDLDTPEQVERARTVETMVRPNATVITGRIPHLRAQPFFRTDDPISDPALVRSLNRRIFALYGGDPAVVNPTRLMRLPGTIAWPWKPGRVPELTAFAQPTDDRPASYPVELLMAQLPQEPGPDASKPASDETGGLNTAAELMRRIRAGVEWHNNMIRLVAHWVGRGWSNAEIQAAAESFTLPGYTHAQTFDEVAKAITGARRKWERPEAEEEVGGQDEPAHDPETGEITPFPATPLFGMDLEAIPPRQWLYGRELLIGFVSVLGSPGGVGKTAHTQAVGASLALGRSLLAHDKLKPSQFQAVHKTGPVWFYNLEDPLDELKRRMKALLLHNRLRPEDFQHPLYVDSGRDRALIVTKRMPDGALVAHPVVDDLVAEIKRRGIVLLVVDPFVQSHTAEENRNEEMNLVMALWGQVAHRAQCAVWLIHHFRKGGQGGDGDAFRGAGAIQGAARVMSTLSAMSLDEASKLGIEPEHRRQYVRQDNAKANMAPAADRAEWYRLVSVNIDNASEDYPDGDSVQTIEPWEPPSPWEGLSWATIAKVLQRVQDGPSPGERWSPVKQSKDRWVGRLLMDLAGKTDGQAFSIVKAWIENGLLETGNYPSPARHGALNACVSVNPVKLAEMKKAASAGGPHDAD